MRFLQAGELTRAALAFEAATRMQPEDPLPWLQLGITLAENEMEGAAITALQRCVQLDPTNRTGTFRSRRRMARASARAQHLASESARVPADARPRVCLALLALAVSYTNEACYGLAYEVLESWIAQTPRYADIVSRSNTAQPSPPDGSFVQLDARHNRVRDMLLEIVQHFQEDADVDVQVALGVLFSINNEFDKAADCFRAALSVRAYDPSTWNKLGATLANGGRSEDAIEAYRVALELRPGFVRARFNLGISCANLGAHHEAAEHFLTALHMQQQEVTAIRHSRRFTSQTIWDTLRMVFLKMNRCDAGVRAPVRAVWCALTRLPRTDSMDLAVLAEQRDLSKFRDEFDF